MNVTDDDVAHPVILAEADPAPETLPEVAVHLIAPGAYARAALDLAADHGTRLISLVLVDPEVDEHDPRLWETLRRIEVPTLVIAAVPEQTTSVVKAQSIAGGVDNGVFVIIDGAQAPSHRTRPDSFREWSTAFMVIAEGLATDRIDPALLFPAPVQEER
ncbi:hypothetical protein [Granulicoccus phenolivorans]|uniref:hypothetical protein n=1 Tax=Granulicoccus phenolivorans TaxID=266854 RepID=UPI00040E5668|nr:hypothetical protein [Granulicoccus phenolivorans]